jgi:hypothetical protein
MERSVIIVGIDPGATGGIFRVACIGDTCVSSEMFESSSDGKLTAEAIRSAVCAGGTKADFAVVENVSSMPGQGLTSTFTFGTRFGIIQGVLHALDIPMVLVRSQKWQKDVGIKLGKEVGLDLPKKKKTYYRRKMIKGRSFTLATETFPKAAGIPINAENADGASLALWGMKFHV